MGYDVDMFTWLQSVAQQKSHSKVWHGVSMAYWSGRSCCSMAFLFLAEEDERPLMYSYFYQCQPR